MVIEHLEVILVITDDVEMVHGLLIVVMMHQKRQAFVRNDHLKYDH